MNSKPRTETCFRSRWIANARFPLQYCSAQSAIEDDDEIFQTFGKANINPDHDFIRSTIDKDTTHSQDEAVIEFYKRLRPGDPPTRDNAESLLQSLLFNPRRYDLAKVGRYKLNKRLGVDVPLDTRVLTNQDLVRIVAHMIELDNEEYAGKGPSRRH